jgi:hypothetical protein
MAVQAGAQGRKTVAVLVAVEMTFTLKYRRFFRFAG